MRSKIIFKTMKKYSLPELNYSYTDLDPYISEEQLQIHHQKHHQAYVSGANLILEKINKSRIDGVEIDIKSTLKSLAFNIGGHSLHSLFWENIMPAGEGDPKPSGKLKEMIENDFGSFDNFKKEFSASSLSVEGSGWSALIYDKEIDQLLIMQIEKHGNNTYPGAKILMVLDLFEHAYYLDYKNERAKFIDSFWKIVNWEVVSKRLNK
ncbi:MAG: superoxide dismutase [Candidatus Nealsonbacteria bacterium]|nr:superoxide dismutase [Candidatus Nealsonbacteria bacterium]